MPDPDDRNAAILPPQRAAAEAEVAKFDTKIEQSNVAAAAQGPQATARGTMHVGGVTVHGTAIFAGTAGPGSLPAASKPIPSYPNVETQVLSEKLAAAQDRKHRLLGHGADTVSAMQEILDLKRRLREGGQLKPGDALGDGRYLLLDVLGRGGFAIVWRAHDAMLSETVAIKVLHANLAGDGLRLERFRRGARIMQEFEHDAIVRVLDARGEDGGWHYFVMEYLDGGDLRRAVVEHRIELAGVVPLILCVGGALAAAHSRGIVHRDVKPANVVLDAFSAPKLCDFDLVGAADTTGGTRTGALGSFLYAAPESMHRPQDVSASADVYSLGMTAIFCLHQQELPMHVVRSPDSILDDLPCTASVKGVLRNAIQWEARDRYPNAAAFCYALNAATRATRRIEGETVGHPSESRDEFSGAGSSGSLPLKHFPDYSQPASPVRLSKNSRAGLSAGALEPVLSWLEETWTSDERSVRSELREDGCGFDDWIAALAQAWSLARRLEVHPSRAGSHTNLSYLGKLVEAPWCKHKSLTFQLWAAWLWARGRSTETTSWILDSDRQITGCAGQVLKNILMMAEPVRQDFNPVHPALWGIRFGQGSVRAREVP